MSTSSASTNVARTFELEAGREGSRDGGLHAHMSGELPEVYPVRHGETAWTISGQHTGRTDIPLTERGERDAQELSVRLQGLSFVKVFTSPLQRARWTAELAGFDEPAQADHDLTEWDYGLYESRCTVDIRAERPGWRLFEDACPGGETLVDVSTRADRVIARVRALEGNVLVFAHRTYCASSPRAGLHSPLSKLAACILRQHP